MHSLFVPSTQHTVKDTLTPIHLSTAIFRKRLLQLTMITCFVLIALFINYVLQIPSRQAKAASPANIAAVLVNAISLSAGKRHTCALTSNGGIKCWGGNNDGQLGDGTTIDRHTPVDVSGLTSGVQAIAAGSSHTCALMTNGEVKCWGDNENAQLGDGATINQNKPVNVVGLSSGVKAVAAGDGHTCALTGSGGIKCWGRNTSGQLGDGTTLERRTPVDVNGLTSGVQAIATGISHTCALMISGGVKCWGNNYEGELGDGTTINRSTPIDVSDLRDEVQTIATGNYHTCALTTNGGIKCWGENFSGELGDGTSTDRQLPVDVSGLTNDVQAIAAGFEYTCALTTNNQMKCWGGNNEGELGNGTTSGSHRPIDVRALTEGVQAMATGGYHTCALTTTNLVKCWGDNLAGQLGDGTTVERHLPVDVIGFEEDVKLSTPTLTPTLPSQTVDPDLHATPEGAVFTNTNISILPTEIRFDESEVNHISSVTFSPDGNLIAIITGKGVFVYDLNNGRRILHITPKTQTPEIQSAAFSPDSKLLALTTPFADVQVWRIDSGTLLKALVSINNPIPQGTEAPGAMVVFSPDGTILISSRVGVLNFWRVKDWKLIQSIDAHTGWISTPAFSPDSKLLLTGGADQIVNLWDAPTGRLIKSYPLYSNELGFPEVAFSPDGTIAAAALMSSKLRLWKVKDGTALNSFALGVQEQPLIAFAPDNKLLATASYGSSTIVLWLWKEERVQATFSTDKTIVHLGFHPKRNLLAITLLEEPAVRIWDLDSLLPANSEEEQNVKETPVPTVESGKADVHSSPQAIVLVDSLNVRQDASTNFQPIGQVGIDIVLEITGRNNDASWLQVCCVNSQSGWIINNPDYVRVEGDISTLPVMQSKALIEPTAKSSSVAQSCTIAVGSNFANLSKSISEEVGCPRTPVFVTKMAYQPFQQGFMVWRPSSSGDAGGQIYVIYNSGQWMLFEDRWVAGMSVSGGYTAPEGLTEPTQGFGLLWRTQLGGPNASLGWASEREKGSDDGRIQEFDSGSIILHFSEQPPILLLGDGKWLD